MTIASKTTFIACVFLSSVAFTSTAHAGNAFNKFTPNQIVTNTHGYQVTGVSKVYSQNAKTVTQSKRIKRIVEPVPVTPASQLSYTSDIGTLNKKGFNKMNPNKVKAPRAMPVYISESAYTAR